MDVKVKKFIEEFKAFALRGNVMDMAIGVIIGGAFTSIVTSLTENLINPILGLFGGTDLSGFVLNLGGVELRYGAFITSIINFLIMAFVLFCLLKAVNKLTALGKKPEAPAEPTTKVCPFCCSEIPIKAIDDIGRATAEDVREALHQVIDPELGIDVIDLGLVYGIEIDELGRAIITMTLTTPACPLTDLIEDECASTLAGLVEEFRIDWTWDPRWTMERITPEGRDQLAALGFNFDNMPKY